jgi:hypothetical protein
MSEVHSETVSPGLSSVMYTDMLPALRMRPIADAHCEQAPARNGGALGDIHELQLP